MDGIWLITVLSIVGVVMNIHKLRAGFLIWMVTNAAWAVIDFWKGVPEQGFLMVVYFGLAVWGWVSWGARDYLLLKPRVKTVREVV